MAKHDTEREWIVGPAFPYTASQVKRAGVRIRVAVSRGEECSDDDFALLNAYRASHYPALRHVQDRLVRLLHKKAGIDPQRVPITARPLKTPEAIMAKLVREQTRLNTIQEIAGARIVVPGREAQDAVLRTILGTLGGLAPRIVRDTRDVADQHGYRAVHVVVSVRSQGIGDRYAEIQIRTDIENAWAQVVESADAALGSDLKHGDGPADFKAWLIDVSKLIGAINAGETVTMPTMPELPEASA